MLSLKVNLVILLQSLNRRVTDQRRPLRTGILSYRTDPCSSLGLTDRLRLFGPIT